MAEFKEKKHFHKVEIKTLVQQSITHVFKYMNDSIKVVRTAPVSKDEHELQSFARLGPNWTNPLDPVLQGSDFHCLSATAAYPRSLLENINYFHTDSDD